MPDSTSVPAAPPLVAPPPPLSLSELWPWALLAGALGLVWLFLVGLEGSAVAFGPDGEYVHEFVHDGRHLLAFPCH